MNLVSPLKQKPANESREKDMALRQRRPLNMMVDECLVDETKELATQFTMPRYCLYRTHFGDWLLLFDPSYAE